MSPFRLRPFISLLTLTSFALMTLSGIVAYLMPEGRVAYWNGWSLWGLEKPAWGAVHVVTSFVFVGAGVAHGVFNAKALFRYLGARARSSRSPVRLEALTAALVIGLATWGAIQPFPPFTWVLNLEATLKARWVRSPDQEPPYGHAELTSLAVFAKRLDIDLPAALAAAENQQVRIADPGNSLAEIAIANGVTPAEIYRLLAPYRRTAQPRTFLDAESVELAFSGSGVGNRTLAAVCTEVGVPLDTGLARLGEQGIQAVPDQPLKQIAKNRKVTPLEVLKVLVLPQYQLNDS